MTTEDDTFRALCRTPRATLEIVEYTWYCDNNDQRKWPDILAQHGWTEEEWYPVLVTRKIAYLSTKGV